MSGETSLRSMLRDLKPKPLPEVFTFAFSAETIVCEKFINEALAVFREPSGVSLVLPLSIAKRFGLQYQGEFSCIILGIHSSLMAVGLTATVSTALAKQGISANFVASFHHDALFLPIDRVEDAIKVLRTLECS